MHTTLSPPETTAEQLSGASAPVFAKDGKRIGVVDVPSPQDRRVLALPSQETTPGRAVRQSEALSSALPLVRCAVPTMGRRRCCPATMPVSAPCRAPPPSIICWSAGRIVRRVGRQKSGWSSRNIFACWIQRWFSPFPSRRFSHLCCCIRTTCCHARGSGPPAIRISRQHHGHGTAEHGALPAITAFLEEEALKSARETPPCQTSRSEAPA